MRSPHSVITLTKFWGHGLYKVCSVWRPSPSYAIVTFRKVRCKSELNTHMVSCVCIHGTPVELHSQTHWNLIGYSVTAPPPPSFPPPPPSHYAVISTRKSSAGFSKLLLFRFISYYKKYLSAKLSNLKFLKFLSVCVCICTYVCTCIWMRACT